MNDTMTKVPALSRTWRTYHTTELDRVVLDTSAHVVVLSRESVGGPLSAEVDAQPASLKDAVYLLQDAYALEVVSETLASTAFGLGQGVRVAAIA